jgi:hypothetical protein
MSAQPMPASPLLEVQDLSVRFGGIVALKLFGAAVFHYGFDRPQRCR